MKAPLTPMMKQYFEIKSEYQDCILFFRLGDFYEMFYEDAVTASEILEITLTGKDCGQEERAPMCGVPYHSAQGYIAKLIKNGKKVAICEQVEDPKAAKGIVKRDVIRIITPGTANLDEVLESGENNFLACVCIYDKKYAVSFCDASTGELITTQGDFDIVENRLANVLACFKPAEILINDSAIVYKKMFDSMKARFDFYESYLPDSHYNFDDAKESVYRKFKALSSNDILLGRDMCTKSLGALLNYLGETQKTDLSNIRDVRYYDVFDFMEIDMSSRRNLELTETMRDKTKRGSLFGILDKTKTKMGARRLKSWIDRPLIKPEQINARLEAVNEFTLRPQLCDALLEALKQIYDMERIIGKAVYGNCNARELLSLKQSLKILPEIESILSSCESSLLKQAHSSFDTLEDVCTLLENSINENDTPVSIREGNIIKDGFDKELDRLRSIHKSGTGVMMRMELAEKEKTGIKNLKISYNKVFGYYIEVSKLHSDKVPEHYIRKQTLANCERYITQELKDLENTVLGAKERINDLEYEDFMYVLGEINKNSNRILDMARIISTTDVLCALGRVATTNGYVRPEVDEGDIIDIKDGRHPIVENALCDTIFVPNDTYLDANESRFSIITGPNMAGKSTYMRQTALIVLMAQIGSFVPAKSCRVGIADRIFTRIGASDDLSSGQSTFMVEMNEVAHILKNATPKSLLILDEIGRGTSTFDGLSIAWAVVEYVCKSIGAKSLFATHYHELTVLEDKIDGVKNYSVAVKKRGEDITFLRKIVRGGTDDSFGIEVARLAGVPDEVLKRAREVLCSVEEGQTVSGGAEINRKIGESRACFDKNNTLLNDIMKIDITTLTPIEAMNELYKLQKKAGEIIEN